MTLALLFVHLLTQLPFTGLRLRYRIIYYETVGNYLHPVCSLSLFVSTSLPNHHAIAELLRDEKYKCLNNLL